jgi:hypothetical protein
MPCGYMDRAKKLFRLRRKGAQDRGVGSGCPQADGGEPPQLTIPTFSATSLAPLTAEVKPTPQSSAVAVAVENAERLETRPPKELAVVIQLDPTFDGSRSTATTIHSRLWASALSKLAEEVPSDHVILRKFISSDELLNSSADGAGKSLLGQLEIAVAQVVAYTDIGPWRVEVGGRTIDLRKTVKRIAGWVNKFKGCVDVAVSFDPVHAALPWAAVRFVIQVGALQTRSHISSLQI